jgi:hypothetical protein
MQNLCTRLNIIISLIKNFIPSANDCRKRPGPTTFEPKHHCIEAIFFCVTSEKCLTASNNKTTISMVMVICPTFQKNKKKSGRDK